ncbi:MAG TPA: hypothetical protein VGQ72_02470 [Pyrinomonadaceae bacterium]|jgi:hypothetical protein|nr:hypothetical protein [Pyrinomonadaceae bacterium]
MKTRPRAHALAFILFVVAVIGCKSTNTSNNPAQSSQSTSSTSTSTSSTNSAPATHANIAGKYNIVGTNPNGTAYRGELQVIEHGDVYQFRWNAGNQYDGVGVVNGNVVAVSFAGGPNGTGCGVVDYNIQSDGSLIGRWGYWGKDEAGTENATRTSGSGLAGEYDATGKNPNGTAYKVKITVEPAGNLYHFVWSNNTDGVGITEGDNVAVGIGGSRCGFVAYEIKADGTLDGVWGGYGSDKTGTEKATKQ